MTTKAAIYRLCACVFFFTFCLGLTSPLHAFDDTHYWSQYIVNFGQKGKTSFLTYWEMRFGDDMSDPILYLISPRIRYAACKNLDLEGHYTFISSRTSTGFRPQSRVEIEVNPKTTLGERIKLHMRNRVEFRHIAGNFDNTRYRQRLQATWTANGSCFKGVFVDNEIFWDFKLGKLNENRVTPLGLIFQLTEKVKGSLFFRIQSQKRNPWTHNGVVGTLLSMNF